ncbi:MAG: alkaline phosphatase D family protein [Bacteroidota bacterium]|jgi:phosphodiesterase/alkaline phosphatase D-like protein
MRVKTIFGALLISSFAFAQTTLISTGSSWKYKDDGSNQGTIWRTTSFSDAAWLSGNAELGYGDGGETTVVNGGPTNNRFPTTYFRKTFSITNAALFTGYTMQVKRDDGVVVYVNGTEVYRNNMPTGTIAFNTWASTTASDDGANFTTVNLSSTQFVTGTNTIAVEIHQRNATSSDISFDLGLIGNSSSSANEVVYLWSGAVQPSSAVVVAKMTSASTTCRLVVSTSSTLSNPVLSPAATASSTNNLMAKMTVTGLTPNTTYYYAVQSNNITDNSSDDIGQFTTPASGAFSYKFTVGSCAVNSNHPAYTRMQSKTPLFHVSTGDIHYANPNSATNINIHRLPYEQNMLSQAPSASFFKSTPLAHVWDDHDYCGNNSGSGSVGRTNARLSYQEYVPHYSLAAGSGDVPIYQSFTIGRVHFILSDLRSERGSTSMMGTTQKNWFKNECLYARNNNLIIAWVTGVSFGGNQTDNWGGFTAERTELSNFFRDNNIRNMFILSGDAHMLAIDNGTNHDFSTGNNNPNDYPVFQAAAINNSGSTKGGTYSEGGTFPNPSSTTGQYGLVEVTDNGGSSITITFTGYRVPSNNSGETVLATYTFNRTLVLPPAPRMPSDFSVRTLQPENAVLMSWNATGTDMLLIERSANDQPYVTVAEVSSDKGGWKDNAPATGWNTYRVRNQQNEIISEEKIYFTGNMKLNIFPNPAKQEINVTLNELAQATTSRYLVYDMRMRTVLQGEKELAQGSSTFTLDISTLPAGEYVLHLVVNGNELKEKLIITQ